MATFGQENYSSALYNDHRPQYPDQIFGLLKTYSSSSSSSPSSFHVAVDLATGTGQVARALRDGKAGLLVEKVIAVDSSSKMLEAAKNVEQALPASSTRKPVEYHQGGAEKTNLPDGSVDLITVGQGAHWFDLKKFWQEAARILKPGGTVALFGYAVPVLPGNSEASQLLIQLAHGEHHLGPYWEQPGKTLADELYTDPAFTPPSDLFTRFERHVQTGDSEDSTSEDAPLMTALMPLSKLTKCIKTWSSYHTWKSKHPDAPDMVDECVQKMRACIETEHGEAEKLASTILLAPEPAFDPLLKVVWPTVVILTERK